MSNDDPRIRQNILATIQYPARCTHHLVLCEISELDEELLSWIEASYAFAAVKR